MKIRKFTLLLAVLLQSALLIAQVTTSGLSGKVSGKNSESLPGATVIAVHVPSGTQYATVTDVNGAYRLPNLLVGGPYKVTISFVGYTTETFNDLTLSLGNIADLPVNLSESSTTLNEVVVSAIRSGLFSSKRTGAATNLSNQTVQSIPTITRGLRDFTKMSPLANIAGSGTSFAGASNRYNQFAIDGLVNNDVFGLTSSGTNGGQAGIEPISLDAIEEFQINIAPYDVRQGGFTGGGINAVTKSGTNQLHGSAYFFGTNENLVAGQRTSGPLSWGTFGEDKRAKVANFTDRQMGITLGGPVVKNKLFFFVSGEMTRKVTPLGYAPGSSLSTITTDEVNRILAVVNRVAPSYDPGAWDAINQETKSNKLLAKINWNISAKHKLSLRHSYTYGEDIGNSRGPNSLRFANNAIFFPSTANSTGLELNSILSSNVSNRLLIGYTNVHDNRDPMGADFPTVQVNLTNARTVTLGSEYSSVANDLKQTIISLSDDFSIYKGKHTVTFGTHNEIYKVYNLFVQNIYGSYAYRSLADFETVGTATEVSPTYYAIGYSFNTQDNPKQTEGAANFRAAQLGFYVQDEIAATQRLKITAGLRLDIPIIRDKPDTNAKFNTAYASQGVATGDIPKTKLMWSPRIGFNWDVLGDKSLQMRGGTGLFTGRVPFVWISNQFSNNGQLNGAYSVGSSSSSATPITSPAGIKFVADPYAQKKAEDLGRTAGRGAINVVDKNFRFPQVFRTNLAVDKTLPGGYTVTVEGIFSKTLNDINLINLNRQPDATFIFTGVDTRPRYTPSSTVVTASGYNSPARIDANFEEIVKLTNNSKGYAYNFVFQVQKNFSSGFNTSASYTYGRSKDLNSGTSSVAYSNWRYVNNVNGLNDLQLTRSNYDLGSRIVGFVSYKKEYLQGKMSTQVSLFYSGQSGQALSYIYNGDMNNDGTTNDMIYIPKTKAGINLVSITNGQTADQQWDALNAFIENDKYLSKHRGEYAERNGARTPWVHEFDMKILQEFKVKTGSINHKFQLTLDIFNLGNLLWNEWGKQTYATNQQISLIDFKGLEDTNPTSAYNFTKKPTFTYTGSGLSNGKAYYISDFYSRWRAQFGIRYIF